MRYAWNKTADTPKLTGIPPHVVQLAKLEGLEEKIDSAKDTIIAQMKTEMDQRGFASTQFKMSELTEAIGTIMKGFLEQTGIAKRAAEEARAEAREQVQTNARIAFSMPDEDVEWCNDQLALADEESGFEHEDTEERRQTVSRRARVAAANGLQKRKLKVGFHHGTLNPLPVDWKFSSMTSLQLVHNWFMGDLNRNIPPCAL